MPEYVDFDGLAKHIYNVYGCNDSFLTAGAKYLRALFKPQDAAQVVDAAYSPDLMENLVDTVCDSINCDPVEFAINVTEDGKVSVTKPQDGRATTDTARDQIGVYLNGAYLSGGDPSEIVLEPASEGGVYDVIPAQVDLSAQREAVIGQKVNATYDKETGAVTPGFLTSNPLTTPRRRGRRSICRTPRSRRRTSRQSSSKRSCSAMC